jgi:hypothetical protein
MTILLWLAVLAASPSPSSNTQNLCGRKYTTLQQLQYNLEADKDVATFPPKNGVKTFFDHGAMTLWWLHLQRGNVAVVTCRRKIATDNAYVDGRVEADCNSDRSGLCVAQAQRMAQVKF